MSETKKSRAVFFDKDGTLVKDVPYNVRPELIELAPGAGGAARVLKAAGYKLFVVSNQAGVARGFFAPEALTAVRSRIEELCGLRFDGFYFCPHDENGSVAAFAARCRCRKPQPGLLRRAAREHGVDLEKSWLVGDILDDVEAGKRAGCRAIFLEVGSETEWLAGEFREADFTARDLERAAEIILKHD
ncbi:MAG TPA: HAD family hydrolase [Pyrinomonadaceae bacterium]|jgi:histidinol-phosphate phosphatase family protein